MNTWDVVKSVAGAFVIVYGLQMGIEFAKRKGYEKGYEKGFDEGVTFEKSKHDPNCKVEKGKEGDPVIVNVCGKKYKMKLEEV